MHAGKESTDTQDEQEESEVEIEARVAAYRTRMEADKAAGRLAQLEAQRQERLAPQRLSLATVGFRELKELLIDRGVPARQLASCTTKVALRGVARLWPDLGIVWDEDEAQTAEVSCV